MSFGDFSDTFDDIRISDIIHPDYDASELYWEMWRLTYRSGPHFLERYMQKMSKREDPTDFITRKHVSYVPSYAKMAINNVKNSIFQRMFDIVRRGGPDSYQQAISGNNFGVDRLGSTMNYFIGSKILAELLVMSRVGVFVDMPKMFHQSIKEKVNKFPYIYIYQIEDIRSWAIDESSSPNQFSSILLRDRLFDIDKRTRLPYGELTRFRHLWKDNNTNKVYCQFYSGDGDPMSPDPFEPLNPAPIELNIDRIPFVMFDIGESLMEDVCRYQIALMNMASGDVMYALQANFPFYVEQYDPNAETPYLRPAGQGQFLDIDNVVNDQIQGTASDDYSKNKEIRVGVASGRRYPKGLEAPEFIFPSAEPLKASMAKQEQLKNEIRELVNQKLSDIGASAESKHADQTDLESGLSFIGNVLEQGERQIASLWSMWEGTQNIATISYPEIYEIKTDEERRKNADAIRKNMPSIPSKTFRKEAAKRLAESLLKGKIPQSKLDTIYNEIEKSPDVVDDPINLIKDLENGLVSREFASEVRGYPDGEVERAAQNHADHLARIAISQSANNISDVKLDESGNPIEVMEAQARGLGSAMGGDPNAGKKEKAASRDKRISKDLGSKVRGKGQKSDLEKGVN